MFKKIKITIGTLLFLGVTLFSIQIIGKLFIGVNYYEKVIINIENIFGNENIKEENNQSGEDKRNIRSITYSKRTLPNRPDSKDDFTIEIINSNLSQNALNIDFTVENSGNRREIIFYGGFLADGSGNEYSGSFSLNNSSFLSQRSKNLFRGVKTDGRLRFNNINKGAKNVAYFGFCWSHQDMYDDERYCFVDSLFSLPIRRRK